jgi:hypothetical protein
MKVCQSYPVWKGKLMAEQYEQEEADYPDAESFFYFGMEVAWHLCGCKLDFSEWFQQCFLLLIEMAAGRFTLVSSPAEDRKELLPHKQRLKECKNCPSTYLEGLEKCLENLEKSSRRAMAEKQRLARLTLACTFGEKGVERLLQEPPCEDSQSGKS